MAFRHVTDITLRHEMTRVSAWGCIRDHFRTMLSSISMLSLETQQYRPLYNGLQLFVNLDRIHLAESLFLEVFFTFRHSNHQLVRNRACIFDSTQLPTTDQEGSWDETIIRGRHLERAMFWNIAIAVESRSLVTS